MAEAYGIYKPKSSRVMRALAAKGKAITKTKNNP